MIVPSKSKIIHNGDIIGPNEATGALLNRAFKYGDGLFETIKIRNGQLMFWDLHMIRMDEGRYLLGFDMNDENWQDELRKQSEVLLKENEVTNHGTLRIQLYRSGVGKYGPETDQANYVISVEKLETDLWFEQAGLRLCFFKKIQLNFSPLSFVKTSNSLPYILAKRDALQRGFDDALLFCGGEIAEASSSNIFIIENGKLFTPTLDSGCMPGVMRAQLLQKFPEMDIEVSEENLSTERVLNAEGIFLTNVVNGMHWVKQLEMKNFNIVTDKRMDEVMRSL